MRNTLSWWQIILKTQLILGAALIVSAPASAGVVPTTKQPASGAIKTPEMKVAQSLEGVEPTDLPAATDDPSNLDNGNESSATDEPMGQVTNVSQLRDVQPTDWAYEALRNLVERYGCIAGYPDGTFRGNRAMSRYEFAAGLNACLQQIERLIAGGRDGNSVTREDFATLSRLRDEFVTELATLRTRMDNLEARNTELSARQFSTTTRLNGEAIIAAYDAFSGEAPVVQFSNPTPGTIFIDPKGARDFEANTALGSRVRLNLDTSFSGRDLLRTGLQVLNSTSLSTVTNTPQTDLEFNPGPYQNSRANVDLDTLYYRVPVGRQAEALFAASARLTDIADPVNPYFNSGGLGAISRFGQFNPIYRLGAGAGAGLKLKLNNTFGLDLGYLGGGQSYTNPQATGNFVNGPYGAIAQLNFTPGDRFKAALTYVHSYNFDPEVGSNLSNPRTAFGNFGRLIDRSSLQGAIPSFLVERILAFLAANNIAGPNETLGQQLIDSLPLVARLRDELRNRPGSAVLTTRLEEILAGAIEQEITSGSTSLLTPAQIQTLQQQGLSAQQLSTQIVQQGGVTQAQVNQLLAAGVTQQQILSGLAQVNQEYGLNLQIIPTQSTPATESFANRQTLAQVFPDANLPAALGNQTLRQALTNAGYTGTASALTLNDILRLRLFALPGASDVANQNPVTINLDNNGNSTSVNTGRVVQLSDGTLGSINLLDIVGSTTSTDPAIQTQTTQFRQQFPGTLEALSVGRLFNVFNTPPVANTPINNITTRNLVEALVSNVNTPLTNDFINQIEDSSFPVVSNSYGLEFSWRVSRGFALGGWAGYTNNRTLRDISFLGTTLLPRGDSKTVNGAINFAFPDLGKPGNLGGIIVGVQPITYEGVLGYDQGPGFHIEGLYRFQVSNNVSITPGILWLTRPDHNLNADDIIIGTLRTTFTF